MHDVFRWFTLRMRRRNDAPPRTDGTEGLDIIGSMLAAVALEGARGDKARRLMKLADDFDQRRENSVIMRVFAGEFDLSIFDPAVALTDDWVRDDDTVRPESDE